MRSFVIVLFSLLAACNGSDNDSSLVTQAQLPPNEATAIAAIRAQIAKVQLIGRIVSQTQININSPREFAMQGEPIISAITPVSFGPCADMGILQGRGGSDTGAALDSQFELYKQCTGYTYAISNLTGLLDVPPYLTWDGPNCTGNAYLEMDVPQNTMNADAVKNGVVFQSPLPGDTTVFQVNSTKTIPQHIMIQSAINTRGGVCGPDQEVRFVVIAMPNDVNITGVQNSLVPNTWTTVAP